MMASTIEVPSCAVVVDDSLVIGIVSHIQLRHQEMVNKVTSYIDLRLIPSWERTVTAGHPFCLRHLYRSLQHLSVWDHSHFQSLFVELWK